MQFAYEESVKCLAPQIEQDQILSILNNMSLFHFFPFLLSLYGKDDLGLHSVQVAEYGLALAQELKLSKESQRRVYLGGLTHDTGKLLVPWTVLKKEGKLNDEEFALMKNHALYGYDLLSKLSFNSVFKLAQTARDHHEKLDRSGYPGNRAADELDIETRIITVVDIFQALCAPRVYKKSYSAQEALLIIEDQMFNRKIDQAVVEALKSWINNGQLSPDYTVLNIPETKLNNALQEELNEKYQKEITKLFEDILSKTPNGYDAFKLKQLVSVYAQLFKLNNKEKSILELAAIGGIGCIAIDDRTRGLDASLEQVLLNRKLTIQNSIDLLKKSKMWFGDLIEVISYVYAYYDGDPVRSIYSGQEKHGKDIPKLASILSIIIMLMSYGDNKQAIEKLNRLKGKRFDPDYTDLVINYLQGKSAD